jgi:two-component system nitrate/nitrite response regulator NarL
VKRILLADDHAPTRAAVRRALERAGFNVVAETSTADAAVAAALEHWPDVCVLDVQMPGDGVAAARRIHSEIPGASIVMLTVCDDDEHLLDALGAGASGYLLKGMDPARLGPALHGVIAGEAAIPRPLVARLVEAYRSRERRRLPFGRRGRVALTEREWEVLELLQRRRTTKEIALELGLSPVTVRRHISSLVTKLGAEDRREAVLIAERAAEGPGMPPRPSSLAT